MRWMCNWQSVVSSFMSPEFRRFTTKWFMYLLVALGKPGEVVTLWLAHS